MTTTPPQTPPTLASADTSADRRSPARQSAETSADRRAPERHMVALRLLRGVAAIALGLSAVLWIAPRVLVEMGVLGPGAEEAIQAAEGSLELARSYGATDSLAPVQAAQGEIVSARRLAAAGDRRGARHGAARAAALAIEAQKVALISRAASQRHAARIYNDLDRQINDLEKLYSATTPGLQKEQVGQLLSTMKVTRATTGALFLAYEQQDYDGVIANEPKARTAIAGAKGVLEGAARGRSEP